jgi:hypothetical protein
MIEGMDNTTPPFPRVTGYRLERRLTASSTGEMWLGRSEQLSGKTGGSTTAHSMRVAIKIGGTVHLAPWQEYDSSALSRVSSPHVVTLVRHDSDPELGEVLVFRYLAGPSLDELMAVRGRLYCAEIATIIIALSRALQALSIAGVVHGRLTARRIRFDDRGTPVVTGFGHRVATEPQKDMVAFAALAEQLVNSAIDQWPKNALVAINRLVRRAQRGEHDETVLARWESMLFEAVSPSPVDIRVDCKRNRVSLRSQVGRTRFSPDWSHSPAKKAVTRLVLIPRSAIARCVINLSTRTRAIILASAVTTALVCVALGGSWASSPGVNAERPESTALPPVDTKMVEVGAEALAHTYERDDTLAYDDSAAAIRGDDPVAATVALLRLRFDCIRQTKAECIDTVDEPDSVQWSDDRRLISELAKSQPPHNDKQAQSGPRRVPNESELPFHNPLGELVPRLVNSLGAAAVLALDHPDSANPTAILMTRGEAGWRLREIIASSG